MPFSVSKRNHSYCLGTHFNVNAYDDEADIKITLLEGSVKVNNSNSERLLRPGQQAQVSSGIKMIDQADIEQATAWKDGRFYFNNTDIKTIMRQVSRWYNVEIVYEGEPVEMLLGGIVSRKENISQLLRRYWKRQAKCILLLKEKLLQPGSYKIPEVFGPLPANFGCRSCRYRGHIFDHQNTVKV